MTFPVTLEGWSQWPIFLVVSGTASVLSLVITIFIALRLRRINARIVLHTRQRPWLKTLREAGSKLAPLLRDASTSRDEIREVLFGCKPTLYELGRALPAFSERRLNILIVRGMLSRYLGEGIFLRQLGYGARRERLPRAIHEKLLEVTQSLNEQVAQSKVYRE